VGTGTLAGTVGVSAAALPISRIALGVALGWGRYPTDGGTGNDLRFALFARGYLVDRPRLRLAVGLATASIDDGVSHGGTTADGQAVTVYRYWHGARRLDGSVALEVVRGNLALRLEAGLGWAFGSSYCYASYPNATTTGCAGAPQYNIPAVPDAEPSHWRPFVGLGLVVRPGGGGPVAAVSESAEGAKPPRHLLDVVATGTALRGTDLINDGHYSDYPTFDAGLDAQYLHRVGGGGFRFGLGTRYGYGTGQSPAGKWEYEQVLTVPALFGWAWQSKVTGEEIEILGGLGVGFLFFSFGSNGHGVMTGNGIAAELGVSYLRPVSPRTAVVVGIAARAQTVDVRGPADSYYLEHASGFHAEIPLRIGMRIRL
jgi:hypothetical protein